MPGMLEMEFKAIYRKAFFGKAKKRYASHCIYREGQVVDEINVVGWEVRRSDSAQFSRNLQHRVFDMLLREDREKSEVLRYVGDEIDRIRRGDFKFVEVGIPRGISRELDSYGRPDQSRPSQSKPNQVEPFQPVPTQTNPIQSTKKGIPANIRGAKYATEVLGLQLSSKPKMVYVSRIPNNLPPTDVVCFDEDSQIPPGTEIDVEKMLVKLVKDKLEPIFEALGWRLSELVYYWKGRAPAEGEQLSLFTENAQKIDKS